MASTGRKNHGLRLIDQTNFAPAAMTAAKATKTADTVLSIFASRFEKPAYIHLCSAVGQPFSCCSIKDGIALRLDELPQAIAP